jgi:hypothetical protein
MGHVVSIEKGSQLCSDIASTQTISKAESKSWIQDAKEVASPAPITVMPKTPSDRLASEIWLQGHC